MVTVHNYVDIIAWDLELGPSQDQLQQAIHKVTCMRAFVGVGRRMMNTGGAAGSSPHAACNICPMLLYM